MKRSTFITWDQLKVGLVILIALGVGALAIYKLDEAVSLFTKRYELVAFMQSANGLRRGGLVNVAGQLAGTVKDIEFLPVDNDTTRNLRVVIEIDEALKQQVRADSRAQLKTQGLLGDKVLEISPGTLSAQMLEEGDTIAMGESLDYERVIAQASAAVGDMVQLTKDLREITGGIVRGEGTMGQLVTNRALYDELTGTLARSNQLLTRLQNPRGTVGKLLDDPEFYNNLTGLTSQMDSLVRAMNSPNGTVGKMLRDTVLYGNLVGISSGADSLVRSLSQGDGFAARMLKDQEMYDKINKALTDLTAILEDVRRDPRKYTKGMIKVF
jgi:phospholipid/cholesterol/gamma-HCH transport system substrate-binding protein